MATPSNPKDAIYENQAGVVGFEPTTPNLGGWCSVRAELHARVFAVARNIGAYRF